MRYNSDKNRKDELVSTATQVNKIIRDKRIKSSTMTITITMQICEYQLQFFFVVVFIFVCIIANIKLNG